MINEEALVYKRGDLVEFTLNISGGSKRCRGLVLNTAVLFGRAARQVWIVDMDDATPQQEAHWTKKETHYFRNRNLMFDTQRPDRAGHAVKG